MKDITVPANFTPRDYQLAVYQAMDGEVGKPETKVKRAFLRWHRRAGKDKACLAYMFKEMVRFPGIYYYFFPTYSQGRKALWENYDANNEMKFLEHMPKQLVKKVNNQEMSMELTNGSIFRVVGTDQVDSIMGTNPVGCVFSEFALQDPSGWDFIRPILSENGGWAIFNGTPRGRNHMYELDIRIKNNPKWFYSELQSLWPDEPNYSGVVPPDRIEDDRDSGMDEDMIRQEYGVSYAAGMKGSFYADQIDKARSDGRIGSFVYDDHRYVDTFWDLGVNDSTCIWFRQIDGNRIVWIDYHEDTGKDLAHYVDILKNKGYRYRTHYLPHDGAHRTIHSRLTADRILSEYLREAGMGSDVFVTDRPQKVIDGINAVRARFSRFYFNEGLVFEGLQKLSLYKKRWDTKRRVFLKEPIHDWTSHAADAIRTEAIAEEHGDSWDGDEGFSPSAIIDFNIFDED